MRKKRLRAPFARILRTISMRTPSTARTVRKMRRLKLPFLCTHGTPRALSTCLARSFASTRMTTTAEITNLLDLHARGLTEYCACLGEAAIRARQLQRWIHQAGAADAARMTALARAFRENLYASATSHSPRLLRDHIAADGTRKWLIDVGGGDAIETVFIAEKTHGTLCISSQAGCPEDCRFCATGQQGFNRNLSAGEMIGQLWMAEFAQVRQRSGAQTRQRSGAQVARVVTNVLMMGMGEPLLNFDAVVRALRLMLDDNAYGLSRRRVTVSTSGVVPMMDRLAQQLPVSLAVSLHAPDDALRDALVPLNKKYPLRELMRACQRYLKAAPRDFITFEYCMLAGINDHEKHARQLLALVQEIPCKFNLIPFNPFPESGFTRSAPEQIRRFAQILSARGIVTTIRKTRGDDIDAACGQLAGIVNDRTHLAMRNRTAQIQAARRTITIHPQ